jgi:hypothetical protein
VKFGLDVAARNGKAGTRMSPSDVAGVFSRYFIVGFFLPAFFTLVGLSQALTSAFLPSGYRDLSEGAQIAVIGGAGLFLGLLLLGLNWQIFRLYEGYPLAERRDQRILGPLHELLVRRQKHVFDRLTKTRDDDSKDGSARGKAAWKLDREFPAEAIDLLPTRFGNAVLAFETHSKKRWGLDSIAAWPRIDMLLSEREAELQANSRSEAAFFVNGSLLLLVAGLVLLADQVFNCALSGFALLAYLLPFLGAVLMAQWSVGAATRWGNAVRSVIDLHRFELYERLGIRPPKDFTDERENVAERVNQMLVYGHFIPDDDFAAPKSRAKEEEEEE